MSSEAIPGPWGFTMPGLNMRWRHDAARLWAMATGDGGEEPRRERHHQHHEHHPHHEHHAEHVRRHEERRRHDHGRGPGGPGGRGGRRGGFGGPGPFGFVFPGGPGGFPGGPGFGRGAKVARGDVREALLALLAEEPMHGYQMIRELDERSGGAWRPSPGSVYPVLALLADEGLVVAEESGGKRVYRLTDAGRAHVESRAGKRKPWDIAADPEEMADLKSVIVQVGAAVVQVARTGSEAQVEAASKVLLQAKRDLYRILADDEDLDDAGPAPDPGADAGIDTEKKASPETGSAEDTTPDA